MFRRICNVSVRYLFTSSRMFVVDKIYRMHLALLTFKMSKRVILLGALFLVHPSPPSPVVSSPNRHFTSFEILLLLLL